MLIHRKPIRMGSSYTCLQLVWAEFYHIIFIAFHANAFGGHLNAYHTLHCICLRYYWLGMFSYIKRMCSTCPGCVLANPTKSKSSKSVYNFPIEVPFLVLFVDAYSAGKHSSCDGFETYLAAMLWYDRLCFYRTHYACQCQKLCFSHHEDPVALWVLSHHYS